jgi:hypothetical protein
MVIEKTRLAEDTEGFDLGWLKATADNLFA